MYYNSTPFDLKDITFLGRKTVSVNQYNGNYFGNLLEIKTDNFKKDSNGNIYLIIYFKNQIYYELSLVFSGLVFLSICILVIIQEIRSLFNK